VIQNTDAVFILVRKKDIINVNGKNILLTGKFKSLNQLCDSERFANQQRTLTACTAFLVKKDTFVTAGHCINEKNSQNKLLVRSFKKDSRKNKSTWYIEDEDIFEVKFLIKQELSISDGDFAIGKLSRDILDVNPLEISKTPVKKGDEVYVLGHPSGLPLKYTKNGKVFSDFNNFNFKTNLDTYGGNSGSPVFNGNHKVVGILIRGAKDYVKTPKGCYSSNILNEDDGKEVIMSAMTWKEHLN